MIRANSQKTTINKKIFINILSIAIVSLILFGSVSVFGVFRQRQMAESALIEQMKTTISGQITDKVNSIEDKLSKVTSDANFFANYGTDLFANWNNLSERFVNSYKFDETEQGVWTLNVILPDDMDKSQISPEMRAHMNKLCNMATAFVATRNNMGICVGIYMASEEYAYSLMYDTYPQQYENFNPRSRSWYINAKESGKTVWTEPYIDQVTGGLRVTCSSPFYNEVGDFSGVIGMDIDIDVINNDIINVNFSDSGYAFAINSDGDFVASREIKIGDMGTYQSQSAKKDGQDEYNSQIDKMISGESNLVEVTIDNTVCFMAYAPIETTNWSMAIVMPKAAVIAPAVVTGNQIQALIFIIFAIAFIFILLLIFLASGKMSKNLSKPIVQLQGAVENFVGGNLKFENTIKTGDEIERLGEAFQKTAIDLEHYIKNLATVTAEKERIGAELDVATKIQASMLPCIFPAFPDRADFDIYATMLPAKEVGGDFYDFFLIDDDHLGIVMADVSGKGVPAALFMVIAKTLIKNNAQYGKTPKDIFETVNNQLCEGNDAGMFVTAFMGILEISAGKFTYVNAGHNPPIIKRVDGDFSYLPTKPGFVLAGMEGMFYTQDEITLCTGDVLFMYTDGVTEAVNENDDLFTEQKLLMDLNKYKACGLKELLVSIKREIDVFANGAEQADDITMLALKISENYVKTKDLQIDAATQNLDEVLDFVTAALEENNCEMKLMTQIGIAVEEVFVNIAHYAYNPDIGGVVIRISVADEIVIEFEDSGKPYNPLEKIDPDITKTAEERDIGGLGIFMVKKIMDSVTYKHVDNKNILTIKKEVVESD